MAVLLSIANIVLPVLYGALLILYGRYFVSTSRRVQPWLTPALLATVLLHLLTLILIGVNGGHYPLSHVSEVLTFLALSITVIYLYIETAIKVKTTGLFVLSVVFCIQVASSFIIDFQRVAPEILDSRLFIFHTTSVIIAYTALFISGLYSLMYLLLFYRIKHARFGLIYGRLPSLEVLNAMNGRAATLGFIFLTLAIFLGLIWRRAEFPAEPHFDPKVISAYLTWVVYAVHIFGNTIGHWAGKRLAYISLAGVAVILFSMLVVNFAFPTFHRFG